MTNTKPPSIIPPSSFQKSSWQTLSNAFLNEVNEVAVKGALVL